MFFKTWAACLQDKFMHMHMLVNSSVTKNSLSSIHALIANNAISPKYANK